VTGMERDVDLLLILGRLLLAGVFAAAGVAKLTDPAGLRRMLTRFPIPLTLARPLALAIPLSELAVAAALVSTRLAWWGAVVALGLLGLFVFAVGTLLARGETVDCECFGRLGSRVSGWSLLVRNEMLAAVAGFVVWNGWTSSGGDILGWLFGLDDRDRAVLLAGAIALGVVASTRRLRSRGWRPGSRAATTWLDRAIPPPAPSFPGFLPAGPPVGTAAPACELTDAVGARRSLAALLAAGRPVLVVFSHPTCAPCQALLAQIADWQQPLASRVTVGVVGARQAEAATAYSVPAIPAAVLVRVDGTVGSRLAVGGDSVRALLSVLAATWPHDPGAGHNGPRAGAGRRAL
jgi:thiol-disulfide isomerase/thioredoxin